MKLKKLFAGIVAVAMMATMGATSVFATEKAPVVPTAPTDKQVSIKKVITGNDYGSETVKLEVEESGKAVLVKHSSYTTANAPTISVVETAGVTITAPTAPVTTAEGTLHIQLPTYDRVGTYVYKFHEVVGATVGMTYDTSSKWLVVNVYNDVDDTSKEIKADSNLLVNAVVLSSDPTDALNTDGNLNSMSEKKIDQIDNKYEAGTYTVKKLVKGNMSDRKKDFNFKVTFENTTGKTTIPTMKVDGKAFGTEGIETLTWTANKATYEFTLKHDQTAEFTNVPYGMKVSVVELDDNKAALTGNTNGEYTVEYNTDANGVKLGTDEGEQTSGSAIITNTSTVNVNTGVILDNAPYIALLTIVAAGAVVMIMKKRRNYED